MKNGRWLGLALLGSLLFWFVLIAFAVGRIPKTPLSDLNITEVHSVKEHVCDCTAQDRANELLIELIDNCEE